VARGSVGSGGGDDDDAGAVAVVERVTVSVLVLVLVTVTTLFTVVMLGNRAPGKWSGGTTEGRSGRIGKAGAADLAGEGADFVSLVLEVDDLSPAVLAVALANSPISENMNLDPDAGEDDEVESEVVAVPSSGANLNVCSSVDGASVAAQASAVTVTVAASVSRRPKIQAASSFCLCACAASLPQRPNSDLQPIPQCSGLYPQTDELEQQNPELYPPHVEFPFSIPHRSTVLCPTSAFCLSAPGKTDGSTSPSQAVVAVTVTVLSGWNLNCPSALTSPIGGTTGPAFRLRANFALRFPKWHVPKLAWQPSSQYPAPHPQYPH
jgi:hypothetical protein